MDALLENDTRRTHVTLDHDSSNTLVKFLYPDEVLFSTKTETPVGTNVLSVNEVLSHLRQVGLYVSEEKAATRKRKSRESAMEYWKHCPGAFERDLKGKLAEFLNKVLDFIQTKFEIPFLRWDAKSSQVPLDGSYAVRKPDIACYFGAAHHTNSTRSWSDVATFCEVKNKLGTRQQRASYIEIAGKTSCLIGEQDGRHCVPCIRILGRSILLKIFDRGGSVSTYPLDINKAPSHFLRIIMGVSLANYSTLGHDTSIKWELGEPDDDDNVVDRDADSEEFEFDYCQSSNSHLGSSSTTSEYGAPEGGCAQDIKEVRRKWVVVIDKSGLLLKIWLKNILSISDSLLGRGTTVWEGEIDGSQDEEQVVVKDSWIDPLRKYTEGMILHILQEAGIEHVPKLISEEQVKISNDDEDNGEDERIHYSTHFLRAKLGIPLEKYHLRVLSRLVTSPVGSLITDFTCLGELLVAFLDYIVAHKNAVEVACILHRDISLINLLLALKKKKERKRDHLSCYLKGKPELASRIQALQRRGILADWGYAVPIPTPATLSSENPTPPSCADPLMPQEVPADTPSSPTDTDLESEAPIISDNLVPVKQRGSKGGVRLVKTSSLTIEDDIVLLMGAADPKSDPRHTADLCPLYRTGTWSWMSAELVIADREQPVAHTALHDLESFFYVLLGITVLFSGPSQLKPPGELAECYDKLFNTFQPSVYKTVVIQSELTWEPCVVEYISPYFRPLIPLLDELRHVIIKPMYTANRKFSRLSSFDHDTIINLIITALLSLAPEARDDTSGNENAKLGRTVAPVRVPICKAMKNVLLVPPKMPKRPSYYTFRSDSRVLLTLPSRSSPPPQIPVHNAKSDSNLSCIRYDSSDSEGFLAPDDLKRARLSSRDQGPRRKTPSHAYKHQRNSQRTDVSGQPVRRSTRTKTSSMKPSLPFRKQQHPGVVTPVERDVVAPLAGS